MKTKNLVLGVFAVVFAVGSAFSFLPPDLTNDSVRISASDCRNISQQPCSDTGTANCKITVIDNGVNLGSKDVYQELNCVTLRKNPTTSPVAEVEF